MKTLVNTTPGQEVHTLTLCMTCSHKHQGKTDNFGYSWCPQCSSVSYYKRNTMHQANQKRRSISVYV